MSDDDNHLQAVAEGQPQVVEDPIAVLRGLQENELRQVCKNALGYWPDPACTQEQLIALLWYKTFADQLPQRSLAHQRDPVRLLRRKMRLYIEKYEAVLSLPCHAKCWLCHDLRVLQCHKEFERDAIDIQELIPEEW